MFTEAVIIFIVGALASLLTSSITSGLQWRKWKNGEQQVIEAKAAGTLTDTSIDLVNELRKAREEDKKEVEELRRDIDAERNARRQDNEKYRVQISALQSQLDEFEDFRDWAERLYHQVKALGGVPVKIRDRRSSAVEEGG